jgi:predicted enzyme related to lactoylglutathione lyase
MVKRNIVHVEIPATDPKASGEFYGKLFGWQIEHDDAMNYTMFDPHDGPPGGFTDQMKAGEVLIHVNSEDIDADLKKALALGGSIVAEKSEIPGIGWWGVFKDPTGNSISLFTALMPDGSK